MTLFTKQTNSQIQKTNMITKGEKGLGRDKVGV